MPSLPSRRAGSPCAKHSRPSLRPQGTRHVDVMFSDARSTPTNQFLVRQQFPHSYRPQFSECAMPSFDTRFNRTSLRRKGAALPSRSQSGLHTT